MFKFPTCENEPAPLHRATMIQRLSAHGWVPTVHFNGTGPVIQVTGPFHGVMNCPMPVRPEDDHSNVLHGLYAVYAEYHILQGMAGRA